MVTSAATVAVAVAGVGAGATTSVSKRVDNFPENAQKAGFDPKVPSDASGLSGNRTSIKSSFVDVSTSVEVSSYGAEKPY
jgi:hypothetical protein